VEAVKAPINYNRTGVSPMLGLDELRRLGVRFVSNAGGTFRAATRAVWDYLHAQARGEETPEVQDDHPLADLEEFLGMARIEETHRALLKGAD
jgi:2-methylisocitrate lyase-like PEP mutase family enzyme